MMWSTATVYMIVTVFWFAGYVHKPINQKAYYKGIKYTVPFGWGVVGLVNVLYLIGGIVDGSFIPFLCGLGYDGLMFLYGIVGYYGFYPGAYYYYRWD